MDTITLWHWKIHHWLRWLQLLQRWMEIWTLVYRQWSRSWSRFVFPVLLRITGISFFQRSTELVRVESSGFSFAQNKSEKDLNRQKMEPEYSLTSRCLAAV